MVRYRLLGPLEVESEAGRVDIGPPKRRAVLGALLLARGRVVSADRLVEAVWGDDAPERSTASLQVHVSTLRKTLQDQPGAAAGIVRQAPGYYLDLDPEQIDLTLFEAGCHSSRSAITAERWRDALAASESALGLWRGPLLDDLGDREWIRAEAARVDELHSECRENHVTALLALGRFADALNEVAHLRAADPYLSDHPFLQMVVDVTDRDRYPRGAGHGTLLTFDPDLPGDHVGHLFAYQTAFFDPAASAAQASVTVALMTPASRGRLVFGANGQAAVHLGHFTHPDDLRTGAALLAHAREVIAAVAARGLVTVPDHAWWTNPDADTRLRAQAASYHHPVGTCRMGTGADAVVGPDLRVHGVDGLYVADASVMPQLPRGTTNLATMMIGWRAADIISSHLAPKSALIQEDSL